jgi:hypothetical protein
MIRRVLVRQPFKMMTYKYISHSGMQMLLLISSATTVCLPDTESLVKEDQRAAYRLQEAIYWPRIGTCIIQMPEIAGSSATAQAIGDIR